MERFSVTVKEKAAVPRKKAAISWSSGKDSCYALHLLHKTGLYDFKFLVTTVTTSYNRVFMHGVREELLKKQSESLGIPLLRVDIPPHCDNETYERRMSQAIDKLITEGVEYIAFGDIFLQDIKKYRESKLEGTGIKPIFPLWGMEPGKLAMEIIESGIRARITSLDPSRVSPDICGLDYDKDLLNRIPDTVDPCGENGEFHTFVYSAPLFHEPVKIRVGESVERDGFVFTDLIPE